MEDTAKKLFKLYLLIVVLKIVLAYFIKTPTGFWDEYIYSKLARSFFFEQEFSLAQGIPSPFYPPLYPVILSIAYLAKNMEVIYCLMKIINSVVSTLVIIPAYLLSKELLDEDRRFYFVLLTSFLPVFFSFSNYILAENLFFPLFLFSIYFIYKSLKENTLKNNVLASVFISLSFLTKNLGLILIPVFFASIFVKRLALKEKINFKNIIVGVLILILLISPWLIRNYINFGPGLAGVIEDTAKDNLESFITPSKHGGLLSYSLSLINWIIMHFVALSISSGLIFFFSSFFAFKNIRQNRKLYCFAIVAFIVILGYALVLSNNALGQPDKSLPDFFRFYTGRPILRYIDILSPLVLLLGIIGLNNYSLDQKNKLKKIILLSIPLFIISVQLIFSNLTPINNLSLTHIGSIKILLGYLINKQFSISQAFSLPIILIMLVFFAALPMVGFLVNKLKFKKIVYLVLAVFIVVNVMNFAINNYQSKKIFESPQSQTGLYLNDVDHDKIKNILFEVEGNPLTNISATYMVIKEQQYQDQYVSLTGFWLNHNLFFRDNDLKNIDYLITTQKKKFFSQFEAGGIKVYKLKF